MSPPSAAGERFAKLLTCTAAESLQGIVLPEREALSSQLEEMSGEEEAESEQCFVELALEELKVYKHPHKHTHTL